MTEFEAPEFRTSETIPRGKIAFAQLLETLFTGAIKLDAFHASDLLALAPAVIQIEIQPVPYKAFILISDSDITVQSQLNGDADCQVKAGISDWATLNSVIDENTHPTELDFGRFQMQGNQDLAKSFLQALTLMELDWEEKLSHFTGDLIAHQIGQKTRQWHRYKKSTGRQITEMFEEYLKHEIRVGPSRLEIQAWQSQLKKLEQQTEELLERANNLK